MDERALVAAARVARLATVRPDGAPHVVPVTFALLDGEDTLVSAVDAKPKRTTDLQRLRNVAAQPRVSLLVDHYDDEWSRLWWVRLDGVAQVLPDGDRRDAALDVLAAKYPQYRSGRPDGPVLAVAVDTWRSWSAS